MTTIKEYREKKGWTQEQLADKIGVVKSAVSMWETGDRKPDICTLKKLAELLECTADDLLKNLVP